MRQRLKSKSKFILLLLLALIICLGTPILDVDCNGGESEDYTETPSDVCPNYDSDCDGISNAVENNSANAYLNFDPNVYNDNPSIAHGVPLGGYISNSINLVDHGEGYYHDPVGDAIDTDDWAVLHTINMIENTGRLWSSYYMIPPRIGILDLSLFGGGLWAPDHSSHQNGLDVDVRYVRNDGLEISLNISSDPLHYDPNHTSFLFNRFIESANVDVILYDSVNAKIHGGPLLHWPGHSDHFHVRIVDPDGTNNK